MRPDSSRFALSTLIATTSLLLVSASPRPILARPVLDGGISLMQTLEEWRYPDCQMLGARMSDGGNPRVEDILCRAILTTPDPVDKVIQFYTDQAAASGDDNKSVVDQDDSKGRPVSVRVIVVNRTVTTTTLVISRADAEKQTHIAWSHYIRLGLAP